MLVRWQFWVLTVVALLVALAASYDMVLFSQNRTTQAGLSQRNQYVQQSLQLEGLYRELLRALADLAVRQQDKALADLLNAQGIVINAPTADLPAPRAEPRKGSKP